jgi:hypothetical protein
MFLCETMAVNRSHVYVSCMCVALIIYVAVGFVELVSRTGDFGYFRVCIADCWVGLARGCKWVQRTR